VGEKKIGWKMGGSTAPPREKTKKTPEKTDRTLMADGGEGGVALEAGSRGNRDLEARTGKPPRGLLLQRKDVHVLHPFRAGKNFFNTGLFET